VEGFLGERDLVVRPLDPRLGTVPDVLAASLLDDGTPIVILDPDDLVRSIDEDLGGVTGGAEHVGRGGDHHVGLGDR